MRDDRIANPRNIGGLGRLGLAVCHGDQGFAKALDNLGTLNA